MDLNSYQSLTVSQEQFDLDLIGDCKSNKSDNSIFIAVIVKLFFSISIYSKYIFKRF